MIVGVHTPETKAEQNAGRLQSKTSEAGLHFPVAIDNEKKTWNAWGNNWWPTVYLVDRQALFHDTAIKAYGAFPSS